MSREKGRTRQGKQKKVFFYKKDKTTKSSASATPTKRLVSNTKHVSKIKAEQIVKARKDKLQDQQQAGVINKPFSVKKKVFIRHNFDDTVFGEDVSSNENGGMTGETPPTTLHVEETPTKKPRPGLVASSLNCLATLSPLQLVPLKKAPRQVWTRVPTPNWRRRGMTMHPPKTPGSTLRSTIPPAPPNSIVKTWSRNKNNNNNNSSPKRSLLPTTPGKILFRMPSTMTESPIVKTWTPRSAMPRRRGTMTPGTLFNDVHLSSLFDKGVSMDGSRRNTTSHDEGGPKIVPKTPGRPF